MLEFKIENLPIKIGGEELELKTKDITINEWIKSIITLQVENENATENELGAIIFEEMGSKLLPMLQGLVVSGKPEMLELLNVTDLLAVAQELMSGFNF